MSVQLRRALPLLILCVIAIILLTPELALAAPGGLVKSAAKSPFGRVVMAIIVLVFLPLILRSAWVRYQQIQKTRKDLREMGNLHPQYRWMDINSRARLIFGWVWSAWNQKDMAKASQYTTHWFWQNQQLLLEDWERQGLENICRCKSVVSIVPLYVEHREGNDGADSRVVLLINAKVIDYMVQRGSDKVVEGDKKVGELETIWTFKWVEGEWRLDNIEGDAMEWTYLREPNVLPQALGAPAQAR